MTERDELDFDPAKVEDRRTFLTLLYEDPKAVSELSEDVGLDITPVAMQAMAYELTQLSIEFRAKTAELAIPGRHLRHTGALLAVGLRSGLGCS